MLYVVVFEVGDGVVVYFDGDVDDEGVFGVV